MEKKDNTYTWSVLTCDCPLELMAPQRMGPRRILERGGKEKKYEMKKKRIKECNKDENSRRIKCELKQKNNRFSRWVTSLVLCQATLYFKSVASQRARLNIWVRWRCDKIAIYYDNIKWRNIRKNLPVLALLNERRQVRLSFENLNNFST